MRTRVLILSAALVVGLLAALASGQYLDRARAKIESGTRPVEVLVAATTVAPGTSGEQAVKDGAIVKKKIARRYVAEEAVSSFASIDGRVAATELTPGEQVTGNDFRFASDAGAAYSVPEGLLAVSVKDDPARGVSRMLKPGDFVAVVATFEANEGDLESALTKIVLVRARVLAVDQNLTGVTAPEDEEKSSDGALLGSDASKATGDTMNTVTLALTPAELEKFVFADDLGRVRLALISKSGTGPAATTGARYASVVK